MAQDSPVEEIIGLPRYNVQANTDYSMDDIRSSNLSPTIPEATPPRRFSGGVGLLAPAMSETVLTGCVTAPNMPRQDAPVNIMTGSLVGHYRVLEKIGEGGMGEVFRARDERLGRDVALKLIRPSSSTNPDHLRRFDQEARAAAALNPPNILAIYDVGFEGSVPYIVSELLEGKSLRHRLGEGPLSVREGADYAL